MTQPSTKKILMVEDDRTIRSLMSFGLKRAGYTVFAASDGEEGKQLLIEHVPDLILLDLYMPNMDGLRFLQWVREEQKVQTPIVVVSAAEKEESHVQNIGANGFLAKPVDLVTLLNTVSCYI